MTAVPVHATTPAGDAQWTSYRLIPDDILFFRDGKPSTIGEDHYLHSIFPLFPSTLYGAVRTARLVEEGHDLRGLSTERWRSFSDSLRTEIGEWGQYGKLELRGPWLLQGEDVLLPAPADVGVVSEPLPLRSRFEPASRQVTKACRFRPDPARSGSGWSHDYRTLRPHERIHGAWVLWNGKDDPEPPSGWFLRRRGMDSWLAGDVPEPDTFVHSSALWTVEARSGVGLEDASRTAKKGRLYTFGFVRLKRDVAIGFELRNGVLHCPGRLRLGGEGKTARLERGPALPLVEATATPRGGGRRTVYLATPAFSAQGAQAPSSLRGVIGAAVRGSMLIGGWDLAARGPKALRRAIPAGSVFFAEESVTGGVDHLHGTNVSDTLDSPAALQGFGLTLVGISD